MKAKVNIDSFQVAYQPIVRSASLQQKEVKKEKYEALLRYDNSAGFPANIYKTLLPSEKKQVTEKIIETVLKKLNNPDSNIEISINITYSDIENLKNILQLLDKYKNGAKKLIFEFIEEEELINKLAVKTFMREVKAYNCKFALDDFGKGYATFGPLLDFDFDIIKFDKVLTQNFSRKAKHFFVLEQIIQICQRLNISTVIEHIEHNDDLSAAILIGADYLQGFHPKLGKPSFNIE